MILLESVLRPISPDNPGGEDLTYAPELDLLRSARKGDDPSLSQGEWVRELRAPEWGKVRGVAEELLCTRSKHLQVAAWYAEALAHLEGFSGVATGLRVMTGLLDQHWETCHPLPDGDDVDERSGRLDWYCVQMTGIVRGLPLLRTDVGGYSWAHWDEARTVENLGKRDASLREAALAEGKLSMDAFQRAVAMTPLAHLELLEQQVLEARQGGEALQGVIDKRFGIEGPPMDDLEAALKDVAELLVGLLKPHRLSVPQEAVLEPVQGHDLPTMHLEPVGAVRSRQEAIRRLREVSAYFREREPHSPVAYLVERAARWADMPLERWLASVVKDQGTLGDLKELLGVE